MYGSTNARTYEETHANINDSTIKTRIDTWYEENIANRPEYTVYISDTLFCNDRSISEYTPNSNYINSGIGEEATAYRWHYGPWSSGTNKTNPRLKCSQQNDRFTVEDTQVGNGDLTYPIGLLTTDEAVLAGGYNTENYGYYLYTGINYWVASPMYFRTGYYGANTRYISDTGNTSGANGRANFSYGIRPILNLKPNSLKLGDGSASNPYTVE